MGIVAQKQKRTVMDLQQAAIRAKEVATKKLTKAQKSLQNSRNLFKKHAATMIASAVHAARMLASNAADKAAATAEAQALGKAAVAKIMKSVHTKKAAKKAETIAAQSKLTEADARTAWVFAAGLAAKARAKLRTSKEEEVVLGAKVVSLQKVAGASLAAKAASRAADERKAKYEKAKRDYASKASVANVAAAVHRSDSILPGAKATQLNGDTKWEQDDKKLFAYNMNARAAGSAAGSASGSAALGATQMRLGEPLSQFKTLVGKLSTPETTKQHRKRHKTSRSFKAVTLTGALSLPRHKD